MTEAAATDVALADLVAALADNKCFLGRRYAEWCTAAPTLESAVAAAAMAQDEIGHARSFYPLLRDLAGASPETEAETRTAWTNVPFLNVSFRGWTDFVAANFLFDTSVSILLEAATASSFSPLAQRACRILEEEPLHWLHGEGWTRRLADKGQGVRDALIASFGQVGAQSLEWFACSSTDLVSRDVLSRDPEELRSAFRGRVNPVLDAAQLPLI
ncbi:MAG TPA: phenylacetic acid catabolic [Chloroflexi bacterium]|jgi:phenylacetate-CoA oxygenase PaaI subunit|nr:phenylacetic acid catabolic [Chloroflexota bacterium]